MIQHIEQQHSAEVLKKLAQEAMLAALTAPKGRGLNNVLLAIVDGDDLISLATEMERIGNEKQQDFFIRDAKNVRNSSLLLLFGTHATPRRLVYCGLCGMKNCDTKEKSGDTPCVFNLLDMGIAIGSAVSKLMDLRVDNRIMYTVGMAALSLGTLGENAKIVIGIPIAATSKNIFFDRK